MMFIFEQESTFKFDLIPFQKFEVFFPERSNATKFEQCRKIVRCQVL